MSLKLTPPAVAEEDAEHLQSGKKQEAQPAGPEAQGWAVAQTVIAEAKGIGNIWLRHVAKLYDLSTQARESFGKYLREHIKQMGEHVKAQEGKPDHALYQKAHKSDRTQLSNLLTIARAMNAGYQPEVKVEDTRVVRDVQGNVLIVQPFYTVLAEAKVFVESDAKGRGRPAKPWLEKLKKFILDNQDQFATEVDATVELVAEMGLRFAAPPIRNAGTKDWSGYHRPGANK
jgi:hypothetical protein